MPWTEGRLKVSRTEILWGAEKLCTHLEIAALRERPLMQYAALRLKLCIHHGPIYWK
jgi:hypothetical protein